MNYLLTQKIILNKISFIKEYNQISYKLKIMIKIHLKMKKIINFLLKNKAIYHVIF